MGCLLGFLKREKMKNIIALTLLIVLTSCSVQENLLTPNPNDYRVTKVTEKRIYIENGHGGHWIKNEYGMTQENIGDWLICKDEFRMHY